MGEKTKNTHTHKVPRKSRHNPVNISFMCLLPSSTLRWAKKRVSKSDTRVLSARFQNTSVSQCFGLTITPKLITKLNFIIFELFWAIPAL